MSVVDQWQKLEIPLFYGEDAFSWLDRIERYFAVKGVRKEQWLYAAKVAIGGKRSHGFGGGRRTRRSSLGRYLRTLSPSIFILN